MAMMFNLIEKKESFNAAGGPTYATPIKVASVGAESFSVQCNVTVASSTAKNFASTDVSVADDTITIASHGFATGRVGQLTTTGALPTGLSLATNYYVIYIDADTIKLATSLANAQAGTAVNITNQGSGTDTFTPTALSGGAVSLYQSNDNVTYVALGSSTNITTTGTTMLSADRPTAAWVTVGFVTTAGQLNTECVIVCKGDKA